MNLSIETIEHIAELARLKLTPDEKALYQQQLSAILDYAARLQQLDTSGALPTANVLPLRSVLREDDVKPGLTLAELLSNAPQTEANQFQVPAVLEEND